MTKYETLSQPLPVSEFTREVGRVGIHDGSSLLGDIRTLINLNPVVSKLFKDAYSVELDGKRRGVLEKIDKLLEVSEGNTLCLSSVARHWYLDYKHWRTMSTEAVGKIRTIVWELGLEEANKERPRFSRDDTADIIIELMRRDEKKEYRKAYVRKSDNPEKNREKYIFSLNKDGRKISVICTSEQKNVLMLLVEPASEKNPLSVSELVKFKYSNGCTPEEARAARKKIANILSPLRRKLEKVGVAIVRVAIEEEYYNLSNDRVRYYLADKNNSVRAGGLREESTAGDETSALETFSEGDFPVNVLIAEREVTYPENFYPPVRVTSEISSESEKESELDPKDLLTESEVFAIVQRFLYMLIWELGAEEKLKKFQITKKPLIDTHGPLGALKSRIKNSLNKKGEDKLEFEKENLLSACDKLNVFIDNPRKYRGSYERDQAAYVLLSCFNLGNINIYKDCWGELFGIEESAPKQEVTAGTAISTAILS